MTDCQTSLH